MCINPQKTKEMVICFCKDKGYHVNMHKLAINETIIERVSHAKSAWGYTISQFMLEHACPKYIVRKASKRLYVLY